MIWLHAIQDAGSDTGRYTPSIPEASNTTINGAPNSQPSGYTDQSALHAPLPRPGVLPARTPPQQPPQSDTQLGSGATHLGNSLDADALGPFRSKHMAHHVGSDRNPEDTPPPANQFERQTIGDNRDADAPALESPTPERVALGSDLLDADMPAYDVSGETSLNRGDPDLNP